MSNPGSVYLNFNTKLNKLSKKKALRDGLSAVVQIGNTLWVANDESVTLERFSYQGIDGEGHYNYGAHEQFTLKEYLALPSSPSLDSEDIEEADLEGLAYNDGYLWLVGSHSRKRKAVKKKDTTKDNFEHLAKVSSDGNRFLLARIPVLKRGGTYTLVKESEEYGERRTAAQLDCTLDNSTLTEALAEDAHLGNFLKIPGKDNGFDIEGLAVVGNRVFIGLRGPVLRGWAIILEVELEVSDKNPSQLNLKPINRHNPHNAKHPTYRKHFLYLNGLGIRDLCVQGSHLLILAGPTMVLDGPVTLFRWPGGIEVSRESLVFSDDLVKVCDIPYGHGTDYAEGVTLFAADECEADSIIVVYDSVSKHRQIDSSIVKVDIFTL